MKAEQRKIIGFLTILYITMLITSFNGIAATVINNHVSVEFNNTPTVSTGTVRYVSQVPGTQYFYNVSAKF